MAFLHTLTLGPNCRLFLPLLSELHRLPALRLLRMECSDSDRNKAPECASYPQVLDFVQGLLQRSCPELTVEVEVRADFGAVRLPELEPVLAHCASWPDAERRRLLIYPAEIGKPS